MKTDSYALKVTGPNVNIWKNKRPLLTHLDVELTERCNNNCIHCYINRSADDVNAKEKELNTEEIKRILREAAALGCLSVRFSGGEPLLREDFCELYVFARKLGLKVILFTNATLITPHIAELFNKIPPLKRIEVSLYGMMKEVVRSRCQNAGVFWGCFSRYKPAIRQQYPLYRQKCLPSIIIRTK